MRIALIGLGNAGHTLHLPALAGIPSTSVVGTCDLDPERRARAAKRWKVPVFEKFDAMLEAARPEVVIVATPPDTHAEYCQRSLAAGAHVICEKPFVSSVEEADRRRGGRGAAGSAEPPVPRDADLPRAA
jgi:predicted dehydrogenase